MANIPIPEGSLRDSVTGLYNKNHLFQRLEESMARYQREKKPFAIILWDIDGFIRFNNHFGQDAGDEFLRRVARLLRQSLRGYDEAFRSGPDEFCVLLYPADEKTAADVVERIKKTVSGGLFDDAGMPYANQQLSISGGLVFYTGDPMVPEALLYSAQQALFKTKRAG